MCNELIQNCYNFKPFLVIIKEFIRILQWSVPLILILFGSWDIFKAVTRSNDEKAVSAARDGFIKRLAYGLVIFLVPFFVELLLEFVENNIISDDSNSPTSMLWCWNHVEEFDFSSCQNIYKKTNNGSSDGSNSNGNSNNSINNQSESSINCSGYTCPTNATLGGSSKTFEPVNYKNNCYCRTSIPSGDLYSGSSCSDIKLNSNSFVFSFSEKNINSASDYCYYVKINSGNSSNDAKKCNPICEYGGKLVNNECYEKKLDANSFDGTGSANCKQTCGSRAIDYKISNDKGDDFTYCYCYYPVSQKCD